MTLSVFPPPERLVAQVFHHPLSSGRHHAILVGARGRTGRHDCVVKLSRNLTLPPREYLFEWMASSLAQALGILVPTPFVVEMSPAFANSIREPAIRETARQSTGLAFGCEHIVGPFSQYVTDSLNPELRQVASELLAFDVFIHNVDRRRKNHNMLVDRTRVLAFDHDLAFSFLNAILAPDPAADPAIDILNEHVFSIALKRRLGDLSRFRQAVGALTDELLDSLASSAPVEWRTEAMSVALASIVSVMKARRDQLPVWLPQVEAWVQR